MDNEATNEANEATEAWLRSQAESLHNNEPPPNLSAFVSRSEPVSRSVSVWSAWDQLRPIFSAGKASQYEDDNENPLEWRAGLEKLNRNTSPISSYEDEKEDAQFDFEFVEARNTQLDDFSLQVHSENIPFDEDFGYYEHYAAQSAPEDPSNSDTLHTEVQDYSASAYSGQPAPSRSEETTIEDETSYIEYDSIAKEDTKHDTLDLPFHTVEPRNFLPNPAYLTIDPSRSDHVPIHRHSSVYSSVRSSQIISPSLTSSTALTGYMSPVYLGEPITPQFADFDASFLNFNLSSEETAPAESDQQASDSNARGFDGYGLSEGQASALTLCNLQSKSNKSNPERSVGKRTGRDLVNNWMASAAAQDEGLNELFDDLAYLGGVIVWNIGLDAFNAHVGFVRDFEEEEGRINVYINEYLALALGDLLLIYTLGALLFLEEHSLVVAIHIWLGLCREVSCLIFGRDV
jgi:hypothetical protein